VHGGTEPACGGLVGTLRAALARHGCGARVAAAGPPSDGHLDGGMECERLIRFLSGGSLGTVEPTVGPVCQWPQRV